LDKSEPTVTIFVGRTAGGFIKFLKKNNLNIIEPEILAGYVRRAIINFEKKDRDASNRLLNEIWELVGVEGSEMAVEVTRQFGKLCDMYRGILQELSGKVHLSEELGACHELVTFKRWCNPSNGEL